jgi:hypothetical protein
MKMCGGEEVSFTPWPLYLRYSFDSKSKENEQGASIFLFAPFLGYVVFDFKTEAVHSSETSVNLHDTTWSHITEGSIALLIVSFVTTSNLMNMYICILIRVNLNIFFIRKLP